MHGWTGYSGGMRDHGLKQTICMRWSHRGSGSPLRVSHGQSMHERREVSSQLKASRNKSLPPR